MRSVVFVRLRLAVAFIGCALYGSFSGLTVKDFLGTSG
jgi:hypothetical protein